VQAVVVDLVALIGRTPQQAEHETGDRVVVLDRQLDFELLIEVVDREGPVDPDGSFVHLLDRFVRKVELVLDLAHDLLEKILQRDDSNRRAVFVDDNRHVELLAPEVRQKRGKVFRLGNHVSVA
jgi:hypothetical protein